MDVNLIEMQILDSSDFTEENKYVPNAFYPEGLLVEWNITSLKVGYTVKHLYTYTETYNDKGVLGGYSLTNVEKVLVKVGE